jgi:very-short-patch-repair endonuclease
LEEGTGLVSLKEMLARWVTPEGVERWSRRADLKAQIAEQWGHLPSRWMLLRKIYAEHAAEIAGGRVEPYYVDWSPLFTPIEAVAWSSIRCKGLPFYPQIPVLNYFLDFANVPLKIGVELDGKAFHDEEKDYRRDLRLLQEGWRIFRIPGSECAKEWMTDQEMFDADLDEEEKLAARRHWMLETCDGVFEALRLIYFCEDGHESRNWDLAEISLQIHTLIDFPI